MELEGVIMPGPIVESEVMKATASFDDLIFETGFPVADFVFDDTKAFDTANGMFDTNA